MRIVFCSILLFAVCSALAQSPKSTEQLNLMPVPSNYQVESGQLPIDQSFSVALTGHKEARLDNAVRHFLEALSKRTGMPLSNRSPVDNSGARLIVNTDHASKPVQEPGED